MFIVRIAQPGKPVEYLHHFEEFSFRTVHLTTTPNRAQAQRFTEFLDAEEIVDAAFDHPTPLWVTIVEEF